MKDWPAGKAAAHLKNEPRDGEGYASQVQFGTGGKVLYCLCGGEARGFVSVWDVVTWKTTKVLVPPRIVSLMEVSSNGRWIGVGGGFNRNVTVWDAEADYKQYLLPISADNCGAIAFSKDGKRAAATATYSMGKKGAKALLWDLETRKLIRTWTVSEEYWHGGILFFSKDGETLFTGGHNEGLHAWDLSTSKK